MAIEIRVPEIGENVEDGTVVTVMVSEGDEIETDQSLLELETEKAVVEIPAPGAGRIREIKVAEGDTVKIGDTIMLLDTHDDGEESDTEDQTSGPENKVKEEEEKEEEEGEEEKVDEMDSEDEEEEEGKETEETERDSVPKEGERKTVAASPYIRRLARRLGIDIREVEGSGPAGRIHEEDVFEFVKNRIGSRSAQAGDGDISLFNVERKEAVSRVRRITSEVMSDSWRTVPQVTQHDNADITDLEKLRKSYNSNHKDRARITVTSILLKICGHALLKFPRFNASIDHEEGVIHYKAGIHISVAVDTERGLLVPVVRDVPAKSILRLSDELTDLAERTRNKKIKPDELTGGTFTISNLGGIGGDWFTPIVYPPQAAILGVGEAGMRPIYADGEFRPRLMLPLTLTYDHRIIDGADGARFLRWIVRSIEHPINLLMDG